MYQPGEYVLYGLHGICKVLPWEEKRVDGKTVTYYVLEPQDQRDARFMVPVHNQAAVAKLRPVMTKEELLEILHSSQVQQDAWIADESQRKQHYRTVINSGDRKALLQMVRTLHTHKDASTAAGRKFHQADEYFLRDAQRLLTAEISMVMGIEPCEVSNFVLTAMSQG